MLPDLIDKDTVPLSSKDLVEDGQSIIIRVGHFLASSIYRHKQLDTVPMLWRSAEGVYVYATL